jgi:hypothetical protein
VKRGRTGAAQRPSGAKRPAQKKSSGGGRPPVNLWPRRIITGLGLILILALLVWGIVAMVRAIIGAVSADPTPQSSPQSAVQSGAVDASGYTLKGGQEATADGLLTDGTTIDIPTCLDRDITVTAKASTTSSGSAMPVTLTLENRGSVACSTSLSHFGLQISTGDLQVYNSAKCGEEQQSSTTLLLRPAPRGPARCAGTATCTRTAARHPRVERVLRLPGPTRSRSPWVRARSVRPWST